MAHLVSQDLSVAGRRAGLAGERSGLFMELIRVIKEMRDECIRQIRMRGADEPIRPRYMVWENVPGAFSSNKGEDFKAVLEETAKVADKNAVIPGPPAGKWQPAGCIVGDEWSIAWRVHDAQYWGVPQRRKRICLLADFNGDSAGKILFELQQETTNRDTEQAVMDSREQSRSEVQPISKGLSGNTEESEKAGKDVAEDIGSGIEETSRALVLNDQGGSQMSVSDDVSGTLRAEEHGHQPVVYGISAYESNAMKSDNPNSEIYEAETARTLDLNGGSPACNQGGMAVVQGFDGFNLQKTGDLSPTLMCQRVDTKNVPSVVCLEGNGSRPSHQGDGWHEGDPMYTLNSTEHHAVAIENHPADSRVKISKDGVVQTLSGRMGTDGGNVPMVMEPVCVGNGQLAQARLSPTVGTLNCMHDQQAVMTYQDHTENVDACIGKGTSNQLANNDMFVANTSVVRRLTPLECTRLQGFPDGWVDIGEWVDSKGKKRKESDAPKYKALGNSIALPFWRWLAERIRTHYVDYIPTMASLFSGIGGFELVFAQVGIKPVWNSEIEPYPEAVTRVHFGDDESEGDYEQYL